MKLTSVFLLTLAALSSSLISSAQKSNTTSFYFDTDISQLDAKQTIAFSQFLSEIKDLEVNSITIFGYCDDRGSKAYNDGLSKERANVIANLLKENGVNFAKIKVISGNGELALNPTKDISSQRNANRRVDLIVSYAKTMLKASSILSDTLKVGDKIILEDILFENSRSILLPESTVVLERLTKVIKEKTQYNIAILGHICCNPPGRDIKDFETGIFNLSQARAKVIYDYLIFKGVAAKRLSYKGMMANFPLGKGEKADRRVELLVTGINTSR